ncbi:Mpv17/PMP22 family protein [Desnuesiella massiliensis]|uniref:Mpv17/PMP22 family protein n=1 Tax=Desnuesiella massiliensis TaxID=1650662 RepID=UPI0006E28A4E|nr:Mpv17/PMP22 family protein [Desnuesiella massiliensis]
MKKKDLLWALGLILIIFILVYPDTHKLFIEATKNYPYIMGFVKVSILATMGELLAIRITTGDFKKPTGVLYKFIIWGFIGMVFVIMFDIYAGGVSFVTSKGLLPKVGGETLSKVINAFFISAIMNLTFAPTFMAFHRVTDTFIEMGNGRLNKIFSLKVSEVLKSIDWNGFIGFVVLKTIPLFWIPAHTVTFILPPEYRVLVASFLSIALGAILATAKKK